MNILPLVPLLAALSAHGQITRTETIDGPPPTAAPTFSPATLDIYGTVAPTRATAAPRTTIATEPPKEEEWTTGRLLLVYLAIGLLGLIGVVILVLRRLFLLRNEEGNTRPASEEGRTPGREEDSGGFHENARPRETVLGNTEQLQESSPRISSTPVVLLAHEQDGPASIPFGSAVPQPAAVEPLGAERQEAATVHVYSY